MGNKQKGQMSNGRMGQMQRQFNQSMSCQDDMMCKNIDSNRSTVDKLVYVCPNATCNGGDCDCGPGCEKDPYTGMCCSEVKKEVVNGQSYTYCIEDAYDAKRGQIRGQIRGQMHANRQKPKKCKVPNVSINGVVVSGKDICKIYNKYN